MPVASRDLSLATARAHIEESCLQTSPSGIVGLETEWHVHCHGDRRAIVPLTTVRAVVDPLGSLPHGSAITYEPGGQLELSSRPAAGIGAACDAMSADLEAVRGALAGVGVELVGRGIDPDRAPLRQLEAPRYEAMEAFFDADGPAGRLMMTRTASVQVNLGAGTAGDQEVRWALAHALGPVLSACFANSPTPLSPPTARGHVQPDGAGSAWKSARLANWWRIDPTRTKPVWRPGGDGRRAWLDYALDARVMLVRTTDGFRPLCEPLSFGRWLAEGHDVGHPTIDDLDYHLTTLFPPVRLRGWLELRYLDAVPDPWWQVATAVSAALMDDPAAAERAARIVAPVAGCWQEAARDGLSDRRLHAAARGCFDAALEALDRMDVAAGARDLCARYADRFVGPGRCPADEGPVDEETACWST